MQDSHTLHPANASELANIARETGAEVLRGALRYPGATGGWQLGDVVRRRLRGAERRWHLN